MFEADPVPVVREAQKFSKKFTAAGSTEPPRLEPRVRPASRRDRLYPDCVRNVRARERGLNLAEL